MLGQMTFVLVISLFILNTNRLNAQNYCDGTNAPSLMTMQVRFGITALHINGEVVLNEDVIINTIKDNQCVGSALYPGGGPTTLSINGAISTFFGYSNLDTIKFVLESDSECVFDSIVINDDPTFALTFVGNTFQNIDKIDFYRRAAAYKQVNPTCGESNGIINAIPGSGKIPFTYQWAHDNTLDMGELINLPASEYQVTIQDALGCEEVLMISLEDETEVPIVELSETLELCEGEVETLSSSFSDGSTEWFDEQGEPLGMEQEIDVSTSGIYSVIITNTDGCTASAQTEVIVNDLPMVDLGADIAECEGTVVTLESNIDDGNVQWFDNQNNEIGVNENIEISNSGTYSIIVTNDNGCTATDEITVSFNVVPTVSIPSGISLCEGQSQTINVGNEDLEIVWTNENGEILSQEQTIEITTAGLYIITAVDSFGCTTSDTTNVSLLPAVQIIEDQVSDISCFGASDGAIELEFATPSDGYIFQWSNGSTEQNIYNLGVDSYSVMITNEAGCQLMTFYQLAEPIELSIDIELALNAGTATAMPSGGTPPYTISWSNGQTGMIAENLVEGEEYILTIIDANDCMLEESFVFMSTSVSESTYLQSIEVYPNPNAGIMTIQKDITHLPITVNIYSMIGERIFTETLNKNSNTIDISNASNGLYLLVINQGNNQVCKKITKMN